MLIEKDVDPLAGELFFKYAVPVWDKLTERERKLAAKFVEDPVKNFWKIVLYCHISSYSKSKEELKKEDPLMIMLLEYAEKKGWIKEDEWGVKHFIWERNIEVDLEEDENGEFLPRHYWDPPLLKKIKEALEEIKEKGAEEFLEIETKIGFDVYWSKNELYISPFLTSKALGRRVKNEEKLSFEETEKIVGYLYEQWKKLKKL